MGATKKIIRAGYEVNGEKMIKEIGQTIAAIHSGYACALLDNGYPNKIVEDVVIEAGQR